MSFSSAPVTGPHQADTDRGGGPAGAENISPGIHIVAKPAGPACNLDCDYCFYLEKQALFGTGRSYRTSDRILSRFITEYIRSQPAPVVEFVWQGGEPTLLGIDFFKRAVELQAPFASQKTIINSPDQRDPVD